MMKPNMDLRISYFPGKFIQGNHAVKELDQFITLFGGRPFLLVTPSMKGMIGQSGTRSFPSDPIVIFSPKAG